MVSDKQVKQPKSMVGTSHRQLGPLKLSVIT